MKISVSTLILAGGKSSRMGEDKAFLQVRGKPLLTHIYQVAQEGTSSVYIITPFAEKYSSILPKNCFFIDELNPFQAPLIAINQSVQYFDTEWVLILAYDLPYLTVKEVKIWLEYLPTISEKVNAFLPRNSEKGWECLCGFYRLKSLANLTEFINQGNRSIQKWLKTQNVEPIPITNSQILFNCNTKEDYQKLL